MHSDYYLYRRFVKKFHYCDKCADCVKEIINLKDNGIFEIR